MDYNNIIKGRISETVAKILLEDAGYLVTSLGIENVVNTLPQFSRAEYKSLGLPPTLRRLPDLFVIDKEDQKTWFLEVKYRQQWNDFIRSSLDQILAEQARSFQSFVLLLVVGESAHIPTPGYSPSEEPSYRVRVAPLELRNAELILQGSNKRFLDATWEDFSRIQDYFTKLSGRWGDQTIRKGIEILKSLKNVNLFDIN